MTGLPARSVVLTVQQWSTSTLEEFVASSDDRTPLRVLSDPTSASLTHRAGQIGQLAFGELIVDSDVSLYCGDLHGGYRLTVLHSGRLEPANRRLPITAEKGRGTVYQPHGDTTSRWTAGTRMVVVTIDRGAVDKALSDALGRQTRSSIDFEPTPTATGSVRSWVDMLLMLAEQSFHPGSVLTQPLAGAPFVDSLVRGLLLVADHPHRDEVAADPKTVAPRTVRAAIDIIDAEAHLPLTVSELASRIHVSVRSLQDGFRKHLGTSPMAYLREVRLGRAHEALVRSDPSITTVAAIAYEWGFTNLGRFAAAHASRFGEGPAVTLRRSLRDRSA